MCIVVVDDECELRELMSHLLEDEGYRVVTFSHPRAVTMLHESDERPHLFLIDMVLPGMSGIELARWLREQGFEQTPKIAMSASEHHVREARLSCLFRAAIDKPFDIDDLLDTVEQNLLA